MLILRRNRNASNYTCCFFLHYGLLAFVSLTFRTCSALVMGKAVIQPSSQLGWVPHSENENDYSSRMVFNAFEGDRNKPNFNGTLSNAYNTRDEGRSPNFESMAEKSKKEMEWLVRSTEKIFGPEAPLIGEMNGNMVKLTMDLMSAWSRRAKKDGSKSPHVVERLLQRLIQESDAGNTAVIVDTSLYNRVLDSWANSNEEGSAERSEEILQRMERMSMQDGNLRVKPDVSSYNAVIKAHVKNGSRQIAAAKAESLVQRMENQCDQMGVAPNRRSYNLLLYSLANSNLENIAEHAEAILHKMSKRYKDGDAQCKPDINTYNQVLSAWARGKDPGFEYRMQSIYKELLNLPRDMGIQPNTDSFNAVMGGWLKSNHSSSLEIITGVLATMEQSYANGNIEAKPDRVTINTLTAAYIKDDQIEKSMEEATLLEKRYKVVPNTISHNIVVDSWCKSGRPDSPSHVLELLTTMENAYKKGKATMKPDGYTYSSVIGCFSKFNRKDATEVAEDLLRRMNILYSDHGGDPPTTSVYNSVINAWTTYSDTEEGLKRIKELLQLMEENDGKDISIPRPNRITYNTVIKAMRDGTTKSAKFAEKILAKLEELGMDDPQLLPNSHTYSSTITSVGRSDSPRKAERAFAILERMLDAAKRGNMAATPTTHVYNAVLNAAAFARGDEKERMEAFEISMKTYELLKEKGTPDHTTYGTLLRICATLVPPVDQKRELLVDEIFREACETGNVGRLVVNQLKFASNPQQHIRLTGKEITERINPKKDFPNSWTVNVRENERRIGKT